MASEGRTGRTASLKAPAKSSPNRASPGVGTSWLAMPDMPFGVSATPKAMPGTVVVKISMIGSLNPSGHEAENEDEAETGEQGLDRECAQGHEGSREADHDAAVDEGQQGDEGTLCPPR